MNLGLSTGPAAASGTAKLGAPGRSINPAPSFEADAVRPTTTSSMPGAVGMVCRVMKAQSNATAQITTAIVAMTERALTAGGATPPAQPERHYE